MVAIADEIYEHMTYDGHEHVPIASLPGMRERTIAISGLSKTYAATGWRVGWVHAAEAWTDGLRKIHDFTTICAPAPLQKASVTAVSLPDAYYEEMRAWYAQRRERTVALLRAAGFTAEPPEGAYYLMAGIDRPAARRRHGRRRRGVRAMGDRRAGHRHDSGQQLLPERSGARPGHRAGRLPEVGRDARRARAALGAAARRRLTDRSLDGSLDQSRASEPLSFSTSIVPRWWWTTA